MKKIKMKDTILSHYQKVHELKMYGLTVRVWKPRTMQQLPAYMMRTWLKHQAHDWCDYIIDEDCSKAIWRLGNPDWGLWDALTVYHIDPRRKTLDVYFAALLVRPFSKQAHEYYTQQHDYIDDVNQRLMLMWDSREFDRIGGTTTSCGLNGFELAKYENLIYCVRKPDRDLEDKQEDLEDTSPNFYSNEIIVDYDEARHFVKLHQKADGTTEYDAHVADDSNMVRGGTPLMHACARCYTDFRKEHPEVIEMHFYTD